jgi:hypothetical protein
MHCFVRTQVMPEVKQIIQVLELTAGIEAVGVGRQAEESHIVAQVRLHAALFIVGRAIFHRKFERKS